MHPIKSLLVAILAVSAPAQEVPRGIAWMPDWDQALAIAKVQDKPIMVAFVLNGEPANEAVMKQHFRDAKIVAESRHFICLVACMGLTEIVEGIRADGAKGEVSRKLGSSSPNEIRAVEQRARDTLMRSSVVSCPQFVFLAPDGESVLLRHVWMLPAPLLLKKMRTARALHDPSVATPEMKVERDLITTLIKQANSTNQAKRRTALQTVAMMDDPRITDLLMAMTKSRAETQKRLEALILMGQRGNAKVLSVVHGLLTAKDFQTRSHAAVAIGQIGMEESAEFLAQALKKERNDRVRSHLLRAFVATSRDDKAIEAAILSMLKRNSQLDRITALHVMEGLEKNPPLVKALLKAIRHSDGQVRAAAYVAIGALIVKEARKQLERRVSSEKGDPKIACMWAIDRLGGKVYEGEEDPSEGVIALLPDNHLYEGDLDAEVDSRGRRGGGRGGRGGGRSGGRGGRRGR